MISDYPELIAEVAERSGVSDVATRAKMYVGMAEKALSKRLRLAEQEKSVELVTDATGAVDLPADFEEIRTILVGDRYIDRKPLEVILRGRQTGYAVEGRVLKSSHALTAHQLVYYASLPGLEANNTNWLLDDEPEIYLHAVLFQVYTAKNDIARAEATAAYLAGLIEAANRAATMKRIGATRVNFARISA